MPKISRAIIGLFCLLRLLLTSDIVPASDGTKAISGDDPALKKFVANFVVAVNSKDPAKIKKLVHSKSLSCITKDSKDFFDGLFVKDVAKHIPSDYRVEAHVINSNEQLPFAHEFTYPVRPTHVVQIDYDKAPNSNVTMVRQVVKEGGRWMMVMPCPTPETLVKFRELKILKARHEEQVKMLFSNLKEPLLSELKELLRQGRKVDAIQRYSAASGEDLAVSKDVITLLTTENKRE